MAQYRTFQVKLNTDKDAARIAWLEQQGSITQAIRDLVDEAMADAPEITAAFDLGAIRAIMETVLDERLAGNLLPIAGQQAHDPELDAKLDGMF